MTDFYRYITFITGRIFGGECERSALGSETLYSVMGTIQAPEIPTLSLATLQYLCMHRSLLDVLLKYQENTWCRL